jgi:hypothetical protein
MRFLADESCDFAVVRVHSAVYEGLTRSLFGTSRGALAATR